METAVITWGTIKAVGYIVTGVLALSGFAWGVYYLSKSNKREIDAIRKDMVTEKEEREKDVKKLHERIDKKQEKFEACVRRIEAKQDESNKLLHMIAGKLGVTETKHGDE